jgi:hypothetical protein
VTTNKCVWNVNGQHPKDPQKPDGYWVTSNQLLIASDIEDAIAIVKQHYKDQGMQVKILNVSHRGQLTINSYLEGDRE